MAAVPNPECNEFDAVYVIQGINVFDNEDADYFAHFRSYCHECAGHTSGNLVFNLACLCVERISRGLLHLVTNC